MRFVGFELLYYFCGLEFASSEMCRRILICFLPQKSPLSTELPITLPSGFFLSLSLPRTSRCPEGALPSWYCGGVSTSASVCWVGT